MLIKRIWAHWAISQGTIVDFHRAVDELLRLPERFMRAVLDFDAWPEPASPSPSRAGLQRADVQARAARLRSWCAPP